MVYYGALSKGCQRCRKRKVKCDQRKPACMRCEQSDLQCPGYRNLNDVMFRDECARIERRVRRVKQPKPDPKVDSLPTLSGGTDHGTASPDSGHLLAVTGSILKSRPLSQSVDDLGANFFFAKYAFNEPPFSTNYHDWLTKSYAEDDSSPVLRAVIEAVGMAGISNVSPAPRLAAKSKERYSEALGAMKQALKDPAQAVMDTTFMAVILLGFFETLNFETWDRYESWAAHVKGATAMLELRGAKQFTTERGVLLYILIRSQIILSCIQQHLAVPPALVNTTYRFVTSGIRKKWQAQYIASPGSLCEMAFRVVNLLAALRGSEPLDHHAIRTVALDVEEDLATWKAGLPPLWQYSVIETIDSSPDSAFLGQRHVYSNLWIAEVWNNWRALRILTNQILMQNDRSSPFLDADLQALGLSRIQQCSADICLSAAAFTVTANLTGSRRVLTLIRPLYVVASEKQNTHEVRLFATQQLRRIEASLGIRQAGLLADTVAKSDELPFDAFISMPRNLRMPLLPSG